jgi:hypothetical protein
VSSKEHTHRNKPVSKAEAKMRVCKSFRKPEGGRSWTLLFFFVFSNSRSVLFTKKQKPAESRSDTLFKGVRKILDFPFKPDLQCPRFRVNNKYQEIEQDFFFFFEVLEFELRAFTLNHSTRPVCWGWL